LGLIKSQPKRSIYYFDESRFGTHSKLGHGWSETGRRTTVPARLGFKNFYLYTAACPQNGDEFSLIMSHVDTDCMNVFLQEFAAQLPDGVLVTIVMDNAGWHTTNKLKIPENIEIVFQPPYSPEINPVERLWGYIKAHVLRNRIYESLEELKEAVCEFVAGLTRERIMSVCRVPFMPTNV
jgi:transposase